MSWLEVVVVLLAARGPGGWPGYGAGWVEQGLGVVDDFAGGCGAVAGGGAGGGVGPFGGGGGGAAVAVELEGHAVVLEGADAAEPFGHVLGCALLVDGGERPGWLDAPCRWPRDAGHLPDVPPVAVLVLKA
ncbi:MAG TPA: hypothetical protein VI365_06860 [Trebonia sp.]